jgi:hypothetical protein
MSGAFIENLSLKSDDEVGALVRPVLVHLEIDLPSIVVRVEGKAEGRHHGRFHPRGRSASPRVWRRTNATYPRSALHLMHCVFSHDPRGKRFERGMRGGPPSSLRLESWEEDLVCIVAHEGYHARELIHGGPKRRVRWSEVGAEWMEYAMLIRYRNGELR